jgi:hypothetical protein
MTGVEDSLGVVNVNLEAIRDSLGNLISATADSNANIIAKLDTLINHVDIQTDTLQNVSTKIGIMSAKFVSGTDIGDVTVNNASGGSAVNIQDGGNTITVDGAVTANIGTVGTLATEATLDDIKTMDLATSITIDSLSVGTSWTQLTTHANAVKCEIFNESGNIVYLGNSNTSIMFGRLLQYDSFVTDTRITNPNLLWVKASGATSPVKVITYIMTP